MCQIFVFNSHFLPGKLFGDIFLGLSLHHNDMTGRSQIDGPKTQIAKRGE